ncbi:hypothetical protein [Serratia marcescens]|uniref:hypothetical protein n=1 Tax=Serratia marcescens TaxID=615 RepID=UPI002243917E|nr:hypothetical protein [Serratia marcescens]
MKIVTRAEAINLGQLRFYTGKPCRNGHYSERFTSNGVCVECSAQHSSAYRKHIKKLIHDARAKVAEVR